MFTKTWRSTVLIAGETMLLVAAVAVGAYIRLGSDSWFLLWEGWGVLRVLLVMTVCQVCLHYADLYDLTTISDRRDLIVRLFQALGASSLILAWVYFWFPDWVIGRGVFFISAILVVSLVVVWRLTFAWLTNRVGPRERLLMVGTTPAAVELVRELFERRQELGVEIVGFIDPDPAKVGTAVLNPGVIGAIEDIPAIVSARHVDRVVVSLADARGRLPMEKLLGLKLSGTSFDDVATVYEEYTGKIALENLRPSWFIFSAGFRISSAQKRLKRLCDVVLSLIGLLAGAPLMLLTAIAVRLSSPGPILYSQTRVGQYERPFTIYKFRTMCANAEAGIGAVWARPNDDRITAVGTLLRRTRLDELPQFWNVLRGDMSFVGPRPERPEFVESLTVDIPFYGQRHVVKPGLTGWAQIRYPYGSSAADALQKLQYDLFYVKHLSLALDLFILFETAKTVALRKGC